MVDSADEIDPAWLDGKKHIGISAGASAPEVLVEGVIARLKTLGAGRVSVQAGIEERTSFPLPKDMWDENRTCASCAPR